MERVTKERVNELEFKQGVGKDSKGEAIWREIDLLEVGGGLIVLKDEWPYKSAPSQSMVPRRVKTMGRTYSTRSLADNSGFVFLRTA